MVHRPTTLPDSSSKGVAADRAILAGAGLSGLVTAGSPREAVGLVTADSPREAVAADGATTAGAGPSGPQDRVIIVGAGRSGLDMAVNLHKRGVPFALLEREGSMALAVDVARARSFDAERQQQVDGIVAYAAEHGVVPELGRDVKSARFDNSTGLWLVRAAVLDGSVVEYVGRWLVVATGEKAGKFIPDVCFPGLQQNFRGEVVHASDYKSGERSYRGKQVLVVGGGNSGTEVALDLCARGALVSMAIDNAAEVSDWFKPTWCHAVQWIFIWPVFTLMSLLGCLLHFVMAWLVILLSPAAVLGDAHGSAQVHAKSTIELAGLVILICSAPAENMTALLLSLGRLMSSALVNIGAWCQRHEVSPATPTLKILVLLVWALFSLLEKSIIFAASVLRGFLLFVVFFLEDVVGIRLSTGDDIGHFGLMPNHCRTIVHGRSAMKLVGILIWLCICLVEKVIVLIGWLVHVILVQVGVQLSCVHDSGTDMATMIRCRRIIIVPGVARFRDSRVELKDGRTLDIDAVLFTTRRRSNLPQAQWYPGGNVVRSIGYPRTAFPGGWNGQSGLYAVGIHRHGHSGDPVLIVNNISKIRSRTTSPANGNPRRAGEASVNVLF